jgi:L-malate glycosyltransferase
VSEPRLSIFVLHPSNLLTDHRPHGDGLIAYAFIRELSARGHRVHVAAEEVDLADSAPDGVEIHEIRPRSRSVLVARLRYMYAMRRALREVNRREPLDVLLQLNPVTTGVSLGAAGCPLPLVLGPYVPSWPRVEVAAETVSGRLRGYVAEGMEQLRIQIARVQQRRATDLMVSNQMALARLSEEARPRATDLPLGIDAELFSPGSGDGEEPSRDVLFVGRLEPRKGVRTLVDAFDEVLDEVPDARLVMAGHGELDEEIKRRTARERQRGRVVVLGTVPRRELPELMRASAVFCLPSFGDPNPVSALEAMACGRPIVATRAGGLGQCFPEEGGHKVEPGDVEGLANALISVLNHPEGAAQMGQVNRRVIEERHAWPKVGQQLERILRNAVSARPG